MTVSSIVPVNNYSGNSSTTQFDFDFLIESEDELVVQHTDADGVVSTLTLGVDYSIKETGNDEGSYITFPLSTSSYDVLGEDEIISLMLSLTIKQESEFKNSSYFNFTILEWTFDYIVRILQILSRQIERCIKVNEGSSVTGDTILEELNSVLGTCVSASNYALESQEELISYISNIEEQIASFNTSYEEQISAANTLYEEQVSEMSALYEEYYQSILDTGLETKLNQNQITNCILEIPQNINVELQDGTLTLKAGSIVTVPYGTSEPELSAGDSLGIGTITDVYWDEDNSLLYYYVEIPEDITYSGTGSGYERWKFINLSTGAISTYRYGYTQESQPGSTDSWWDTANNIIYGENSGSITNQYLSLPFCKTMDTTTAVERITYVFNAMGFYGGRCWIDKNIKMLIPNGRNDDGTLNNLEYTIPGVYFNAIHSSTREATIIFTTSNYSLYYPLSSNVKSVYALPDASSETTYQQILYSVPENKWYHKTTNGETYSEIYAIPVMRASFTSGTVDSITPVYAFQAADKNSTSIVSYITETYLSGTSWYRLYSDGWCEQGGFATSSGFVTFLQSYADNNFTVCFARHYSSASSSYSSSTTSATHSTVAQSTQYGSTSGTGFYLYFDSTNGGDGIKWVACGYV